MPDPQVLATEPKNGIQLMVEFEQANDRWLHRIKAVELDDGGAGASANSGEMTLLSSIEGTSDQDWPASGALQEVTMQELGDNLVILGVGMAGCAHWSVSCSVHGAELKFDWACLVKDATEISKLSERHVGSKYRIHDKPDDLSLRVETLAQSESSNDWSTLMTREGDTLVLNPGDFSKSQTVATRWAYTVKIG